MTNPREHIITSSKALTKVHYDAYTKTIFHFIKKSMCNHIDYFISKEKVQRWTCKSKGTYFSYCSRRHCLEKSPQYSQPVGGAFTNKPMRHAASARGS
jgi:hypothetical protein